MGGARVLTCDRGVNISKHALAIIEFRVCDEQFLGVEAHVGVTWEERVAPQVMSRAAAPGLPDVHVQLPQHLQQTRQACVSSGDILQVYSTAVEKMRAKSHANQQEQGLSPV